MTLLILIQIFDKGKAITAEDERKKNVCEVRRVGTVSRPSGPSVGGIYKWVM